MTIRRAALLLGGLLWATTAVAQDPCSQAGLLQCGQTVSGTIDGSTDCPLDDGTFLDFWVFAGEPGQDIVLDLRSPQFDTFLFLLRPNGQVETTDDDGGSGTNSRISYQLDESGQWVAAVNNFAPDDEGDYTLTLNCPAQPTGPDVGPGTSGSWYDPTHDGEGWKIEIIDAETAVVYWFSYPPAGGNLGDQAWVIGVGRIEGNRIIIDDAVMPTGGIFGPEFDPTDVVNQPWGSMTFTFTGPNRGTMSYQGPPSFGSGSFSIQRLTGIPPLQGDMTPLPVVNLGYGFSGSWFDPAHDGEGWTIEVIDKDTVVVYWFTYDGEGKQAWNVSIGRIIGDTIIVSEPLEGFGTVFGPNFDPADVRYRIWGGFVMRFLTCNRGTVDYASLQGLGDGRQQVRRLTAMAGLNCTFPDVEQPGAYEVAVNRADPLLIKGRQVDGTIFDVFGPKDASGKAAGIASVAATSPLGDELTLRMDADNRPALIVDKENRHTFQFLYSGPGAPTAFKTTVDGGAVEAVIPLDPAALKAASLATPPAAPRRGTAFAFPGPARPAPPAGDAATVKAGTASVITVRRCENPVNDAFVEVIVDAGDESFSVPAVPSGGGTYTAAMPTTVAGTADPEPACLAAQDQMLDSCRFVRDLTVDDFARMCHTQGQILAESGYFWGTQPAYRDDPKAQAYLNWAKACLVSLVVTKAYCKDIYPELPEAAVCGNVVGQTDRSLDAIAENVTLTPIVTVPGDGATHQLFSSTVPSTGPFTDFAVEIGEDPEITAFYTAPADPAPEQAYTATAEIGCAPPNTNVTISVVGTDGYAAEDACVISNAGTCNLHVPGGAASVQDVITVNIQGGPTRSIVIVF